MASYWKCEQTRPWRGKCEQTRPWRGKCEQMRPWRRGKFYRTYYYLWPLMNIFNWMVKLTSILTMPDSNVNLKSRIVFFSWGIRNTASFQHISVELDNLYQHMTWQWNWVMVLWFKNIDASL